MQFQEIAAIGWRGKRYLIKQWTWNYTKLSISNHLLWSGLLLVRLNSQCEEGAMLVNQNKDFLQIYIFLVNLDNPALLVDTFVFKKIVLKRLNSFLMISWYFHIQIFIYIYIYIYIVAFFINAMFFWSWKAYSENADL